MTHNRSHDYEKAGRSSLQRGLWARRFWPWLRGSGVCALLISLADPALAQPKETLTWLLRDLPPLTILSGPQKGRGTIDQLLQQLIARMPEYQHNILQVNRARSLQMLSSSAFTCDPSLLWSKERAQWVVYSTPALRVVSNGLAVRDQDHQALMPFIGDGKVDLDALLHSAHRKLGVVAERSYGQKVDDLLHQAPAGALAAHYGNDALGSLLQMQRLGRLSALLGYWPEIRYQALQQGIAPQELAFYPISGSDKYQSIHIACSDTPLGHQAIDSINRLLLELATNDLHESYADWLDPEMRHDYLEDAKGFFQRSVAQ